MMSRMVSLRVDATPERAFEAFVREIGLLVAAECGASLHSVLSRLVGLRAAAWRSVN